MHTVVCLVKLCFKRQAALVTKHGIPCARWDVELMTVDTGGWGLSSEYGAYILRYCSTSRAFTRAGPTRHKAFLLRHCHTGIQCTHNPLFILYSYSYQIASHCGPCKAACLCWYATTNRILQLVVIAVQFAALKLFLPCHSPDTSSPSYTWSAMFACLPPISSIISRHRGVGSWMACFRMSDREQAAGNLQGTRQ